MEVNFAKKENVLNGTFDGKYHSIINLKIGGQLYFEEGVSGGVGFFSINYGTIKNLKLTMKSSLEVTSKNKYSTIGLLVGGVGYRIGNDIVENGSVENCLVDGNIEITLNGYASNVGGLVGSLNGTIKNCVNKANIIINCNLDRDCRVGGILGSLDYNSNLENCYNTGDIELNTQTTLEIGAYVSGIVGMGGDNGSNLKNVYNIGKINANLKVLTNVIIDGCLSGKNYEELIDSAILNNLTWFNLEDAILNNSSQYIKILNNSQNVSNSKLSKESGLKLLNGENDDGSIKEGVWKLDIKNIF